MSDVATEEHRKLEDSEVQYRRLFEAARDGILILDATTGDIIAVNPFLTHLLCYTEQEMLGKKLWEIGPFKDIRTSKLAFDELQTREYIRYDDLPLETKNGRPVDVEFVSNVYMAGRRKVIQCNIRDITARKKMEAQVSLQAAALAAAANAIVITDPDGLIEWINPAFTDLTGYTAAEAIGRNPRDLVRSELQDPAFYKQLWDTVLSGQVWHGELLNRRKDGSVYTEEQTITPVRDTLGAIRHFIGVKQDVSSRVRAQADVKQSTEAVRTAEERTRFALKAAGVGIWDMDYATERLQWSDDMLVQFGVPPGTFDGTLGAFIGRIHPEDRVAVLEQIGKAQAGGADFTVEHRVLWPDGAVRWLIGRGHVYLDERREPARAVGISLDVTDRHMLEAQYQQAQKMEAVGRLAGGVAHDFNNLLTAILGYCELVLGDPSLEARYRADITEIQKAGTMAAALTRQLLAFTRKQIVEPRLFDLNVAVAEIRPLLERIIREDVKIVVELPAAPSTVNLDRGQVEQIVMNLAVNARDAMPDGGTLTITIDQVELDETDATAYFEVTPGSYAALTVTDTGTGMTPEARAHLFEPFFTTKKIGQGTGLGLATVHGIVKQIGGSVGLESEVGKGTSVTVYLPRAAGGVVTEPPLVARMPVRSETVLVVEDTEGLRTLVRRMLERLGYTVLAAANADEAVKVFEDDPSFDVLLTDVVMPGASGPELTRRLIAQRPGLKVLYMSGYTEEAIVHHGVIETGVAFLHKPFTARALDGKIREVLGR